MAATTATDDYTRQLRLLNEWIADALADDENDWPGLPLSQMPLAMAATLRTARQRGVLRLIERQKRTNPDMTTWYIATTR